MIKVSAVIITFNEERNIGRCIKSLADVADEVIVIDSFSTDGTENICSSFPVTFIKHKFEGYIEQKNWATDQATNRYILSLDADEALSEELGKSVLEVKNNWVCDGYTFNRLTSFCGKWMKHTWYPDKKLRLFDRTKGRWGGLNPHDQFRMEGETKTGHLQGDLLHYSYDTLNDLINQKENFSLLSAKAMFESGRKNRNLSILYKPFWRFFRNYILRLGFLDGGYGFVVSKHSAQQVFLKSKLHKLMAKEKIIPNNKNICFINTHRLWGGGEKWTLDVATGFKEKGYKVFIITRQGNKLESKALRAGITVFGLKMAKLSFLYFLYSARVKRILKANRINTLFINLSLDLKIAGKAARSAGLKNIIYRRAIPKPIRGTMKNRSLLKLVPTLILANSEETKRGVLMHFHNSLNPNDIKVIYNGIRINKKKPEPSRTGRFIIGNAGRLAPEKGHIYLLKLAEILKNNGLDFEIRIAGEGQLNQSLADKIEKAGIKEQVKMLGFVSDMACFYKELDLYILSSEWEGFGFTLIEAMSYYKPVISFDTGSARELIEDKKNGFIIPKFDLDLMSSRVSELVNNREGAVRMGLAGHMLVEQKFTFNKIMDQLENIIR